MSEDTKPVRISTNHHTALTEWCIQKGFKLGKAIEKLLESEKDFLKILKQVESQGERS